MPAMLAAVAQLTSGGVIAENLATSVGLISVYPRLNNEYKLEACADFIALFTTERAAAAGAKVLFLPEATDFIAPAASVYGLTHSKEAAQFVSGIRQAARDASIWVSVGIHEPTAASDSDASRASSSNADAKSDRCYNTQLLIDARGDVLSKYRKTHLFDVDIRGGIKILESNTTVPGTQLEKPVESPLGKLGLLTCYDLRFPEPSLRLRRQGADILTYPSAFTVRTGAAHWEVLLRARAIETQCYVMAAAQVGAHPDTKRVSWGHAMIIDPYGSVIAQCTDMQPYNPTFCLAEVDHSLLGETRKSMPLWHQRRHDLYPEI